MYINMQRVLKVRAKGRATNNTKKHVKEDMELHNCVARLSLIFDNLCYKSYKRENRFIFLRDMGRKISTTCGGRSSRLASHTTGTGR